MDYHFISEVSLEETPKAHLEDLAVQNKSSVKYHQFWILEGNITDFDFGFYSLNSQIGVSQPHLYREFRNLTGLSPVSFICDLKMSKALYLLKQKQKNISEVTLEVGINNPPYFAKCFQDKYGIIPSRITA